MGFFAGLNAEKYDRKYSDKVLIQRSWSYFKPYRWRLVIEIILVLIVSLCAVSMPITVSYGVNAVYKNPTGLAIGLLTGLILLIGIVRWIANYGGRRVMIRILASVILSLAEDAFRASAAHDLSFFDQYSSGKILSRITSDTRDFGQMISLITDVFAQITGAVILGIVLVRTDWHLALIIFAVIPLLFLLAISYRNIARRVTTQGMQAMAEVNATIRETVSGISIAKNFRQEFAIYQDFNRANQLSYRVNVRRGLTMTVVFPTLDMIGGMTTALLVFVGGMSVTQGIVTAGAWYLFILSLNSFLFPVLNLSSFSTQIQNGLSAAERVFALIDAEPAVIQKETNPVGRLTGEIQFIDVDFRYKENEPVLQKFNLTIRPGENLALVGHTGAGKTSIAKLIARFYEYQSGKILIDGKDIRTFDLYDYRRHLGIVNQVPFLFSGTVAENVRYARPDITDSEIHDLARQIGNGEWLDTLPQGLHTEVGERGGRLSMGQRQLVSLMRVLVQKPAIFILDEATASIDPFTEWQIQQALNLILSSTTSILVAHRLSTVKSADRIIVMQNGQIIEEGNHPSLLAKGGHYADLYNAYFRHQSLAYIESSRIVKDEVAVEEIAD